MQHRLLSLLLGITLLPLASTLALAQTTTPRPVRVVLPFSAGSGPDTVVRNVGDKMGVAGKAVVIVDNKPGANGWIAADAVKRAAPDGNTLLLVDNAQMALQQHLYKQMPFDASKDFEPIAPLYTTNFFVVVPADSPWKTMGDLIAAAKAKPGQLTYGSWGVGSVAHVGSAMLETATGTQMTHVPFKEIPQLYAAVATGDVSWAFGSAATVGPLYKAKKVKLLALAAPKRLAGYTDIPTVAESAGPTGFELKTWVALVAPKGTPKAAIEQFNEAANQALGDPDTRARFAAFGFEPWIGKPAEITRATEQDSARFADIVHRAKISID